jgi:hypothetical protein
MKATNYQIEQLGLKTESNLANLAMIRKIQP